MYYTGYDPRTMEKVYTPVTYHEKAMQRALIQYRNPENYELVKEALIKNGRSDLIGFDKKCLIPPRKLEHRYKDKAVMGNDKNSSYKSKTGSNRHNNTKGADNKKVYTAVKADNRSHNKNDNKKNIRKDRSCGKKAKR